METRTWEQMKSSNDGSVWIDTNGDFCSDYISNELEAQIKRYSHNKRSKHLAYFKEQQLFSGWQQDDFNGCWSCKHMDTCEKRQNSLPVWKEG